MALTVKFANAAFPASEVFDVTGLGLLTNNANKVLAASDETRFKNYHGVKIEVKTVGDGHWTVSGTPLT